MDIVYLGWSGVIARVQEVAVIFDPPDAPGVAAAIRPARAAIACVTHGHPDHVAGARGLLGALPGQPSLRSVHLVSSAPIVRWAAAGDRHAVSDRGAVEIAGARITAFAWTHAPLLPPGFRSSLAYAARVIRRPASAFDIARAALGRPLRAPTLGFHVAFPGGQTLINYAEGLHGRADPLTVGVVASSLPAQAALVAVEPEDVPHLPRWISLLDSEQIYLYEAHRPWRERFGLPTVDLQACADRLAAQFPRLRLQALTLPARIAAEAVPAPGAGRDFCV